MSKEIKIIIDGKEIKAQEGQMLVDAAADNGVYIPTLCHLKGSMPAGSCRICTVKVNGRSVAACSTPCSADMDGTIVENDVPAIQEMRKAIVELFFVEGNHFCPACEKSGDCELQAMAYRYAMMVPQFSYTFPMKEVDAKNDKIYLDKNRCILCKKCIRDIKTADGKNIFSFYKRGAAIEIRMDHELAAGMSEEQAMKAMTNCPTGAILRKEIGFSTPIGKHKYDKQPIGSDIENKN